MPLRLYSTGPDGCQTERAPYQYTYYTLTNGLARAEADKKGNRELEDKARAQGLGMWSRSCQ